MRPYELSLFLCDKRMLQAGTVKPARQQYIYTAMRSGSCDNSRPAIRVQIKAGLLAPESSFTPSFPVFQWINASFQTKTSKARRW